MIEEEFEAYLRKIKEEFFGLIDDEASGMLLLDEVGRLDNEVRVKDMEVGRNYDLSLIVDMIYPIQNFKRGDEDGKVSSIMGFDGHDAIRAVLWGEKADQPQTMGLKKGDVIRVINGVVKENRGKFELHLSRKSTLEKVEGNPFELKPIGALAPSERENIGGEIAQIYPERRFERGERKIKLRKIDLEDETGKVAVALWNERAEDFSDLDLKEGARLVIIGGFANSFSNSIEISCDWRGRLLRI